MRAMLIAMMLAAMAGPAWAADHVVHALKVTTLSTMLADVGVGEWGYSALVEVDGRRILFDTGAHPDVVLRNAKELGIDLSTVDTVILSHNHDDHTGGLIALREAEMRKNPKALATALVGAGIFEPRYDKTGKDVNGLMPLRARYIADGGHFQEQPGPVEIAPGVWFTGPVPRPNAETNWQPGLKRKTAAGLVDDTVPEDSALIFVTDQGIVILTGCGHAGIMNLVDDARRIAGDKPLLAVIGGLHLFAKSDAVLAASAAKLQGVHYLLAAHCTGIEATIKLRALLGLDQHTAVVAAVGSSFTLGKGIDALKIAGSPTS
jgi:7,8-dihydropterin-6-yl-methyl-4-(beta-D-ribofuranosyl)aminobenzene 5'-phosphate synthase